ncbi:Transcriptional regulator, AraC family protein [Minicystis rosea]|nr:Transcriptional regulator, AraC family protein [Minicystis rosea]
MRETTLSQASFSLAQKHALSVASGEPWLDGMAESPTQAGACGIFYRPFHGTESEPAIEPHVMIMYVGCRTTVSRIIDCTEERAAVEPGDISLQPASTASRWAWDDPIFVLHVYLAPAYVQSIARSALREEPGILRLPRRLKVRDARLAQLGDDLIRELGPRRQIGASVSAQAICVQMVIELLRHHFEQLPERRGPHRRLDPTERKRLFDYVAAHLDGPLTVERLAHVLGLGAHHFSRVFHDNFGQSPHRYIRDLRLDTALRLLVETDRSVSDIAGATGFSDQSHLTRCFKERFGLPPAHYRRRKGW